MSSKRFNKRQLRQEQELRQLENLKGGELESSEIQQQETSEEEEYENIPTARSGGLFAQVCLIIES